LSQQSLQQVKIYFHALAFEKEWCQYFPEPNQALHLPGPHIRFWKFAAT
jgi:hypothetical protein